MTRQVFPGRGAKKRKNTFGARREARGTRMSSRCQEVLLVVVTLVTAMALSVTMLLVGGGADKVKATGERCRGRVMTTQRVVNAFMSRVAL